MSETVEGWKVCARCGEKKQVDEFSRDRRRHDGLYPWCRGCKRLYDLKTSPSSGKKRTRVASRRALSRRTTDTDFDYQMDEVARTARCPQCLETKSFEEFGYYSRRNRVYLVSRCKSCEALRKLKSNHGLTHEEALRVSATTNCELCGSDIPGGNSKTFKQDHDHTSGALRGVICHNCNVMLGHAKDNEHILQNAILYLRNWRRG